MSNVTTTIVLEGQDRASAAINKAKAAVDGTAGSLKNAADQSGKFERGFKGIKDILGGAGGPFGEIADKLGGVESILMGMPAALGPIALGAAAIGAGVAYWYAEQEKTRKATLETAQAAAAAAFQDKTALAERLGVSKELLGVTGDLVNHAALAADKTKELAENEKARLAAVSEGNASIAEDLRYRAVVLTAELQTLDRQRAVQDQRVQAEKDINAQQRMRRELQAGEYDQAERAAAGLMDKTDRLNALGRAYHHQQLQIDQDRAALSKKASANATEELQDRQALQALGVKEDALAQKMLALAKEGEKKKGGKGGKSPMAVQASVDAAEIRRLNAEGMAETQAMIKQQDEDAANEIKTAQWRVDNDIRLMKENSDAWDADLEIRRSIAEEKKKIDDKAADDAIAAAEREMAVKMALAQAASQVAGAINDEYSKRAIAQLEADKQRALQGAATDEERAAIAEQFEQQKAKAVEDAERRKAAILGLMEVANAAASFPNIPAMIAHGVAAGLYGAVALGAVGGADATPAGGAAGIQPSSGGGGSGGGGSSGGNGGNVTNIHFNRGFVTGTPQDVGKYVQGALGSLKNTGMSGSGV